MGLKTQGKIFLGSSIIGAVAALAIWHLPWRFQANDDPIMMWLVSGKYTGRPESYAVFIHPILSWTFSKLYTFFPEVKWYQSTWFLTMYFSFVVFLKCFWTDHSNKFQAGFYSLFLFALFIHYLFFLQFSIVAAFAIAAGLTARVMRFKSIPEPGLGRNIVSSVFAVHKSDLLILFGALIRIEVLFLMLAGMGVLGLLVLKKRAVFRALIVPGILLVSCFLLNQTWIMTNELGDFVADNKLRSSVFDDPILQLNKDRYQDTFPELVHFANGLMDFGREGDLIGKMKVWQQVLDQDRLLGLTPSFFLKALTYLIWHERYFCFLFVLLLGFSLVHRFRKSLLSIGILLGIMLALSPFYLLKIQVYVVILLVYFSVAFLNTESEKLKNQGVIPFLPLLAGILIFHFSSFYLSEKNLFPEDEARQIIGKNAYSDRNRDLYLIGLDPAIYYLYDDKPVKIKFLGWPSLLLKSQETTFFYKVNRKVYEENRPYFNSFRIKNEYPNYLELVFQK